MPRRAPIALLLLWLPLGGCGACRDPGVEVGGPHPYIRCAAVDEAEPREGRVGSLSYRLEERSLTLEGTGDALRVIAFRGPGRATVDMKAATLGFAEQGPELILVLGGLAGPDAAAHLEALAALRVPTVVLPGGEDEAEGLAEALDDLPSGADASVFDGRRLRRVRAGAHEIALASGAPRGRYALGDGACGVSDEDLEALAEALGTPEAGTQRWLASWAAPAGGGRHAVGRGLGEVDAGDPAITTLMEAIGARGGLFAFPETQALLPTTASGEAPLAPHVAAPDARLVLAPLAGPPLERADGSLVPSAAAVLTFGPEGLAHEGTAAPAPRPSRTQAPAPGAP